jgi:hypothetical protein
MQDLWGEEISTQPATQKPFRHSSVSLMPLTAHDCLFFGHTWTQAGLTQEKLCRVCGIKGYCPVCTPLRTRDDAQPFLGTHHSKGRVQA